MKKQLLILTLLLLGMYSLNASKGINDLLNVLEHAPIKKIVIDPGHGGHDSGAVGARYKEKDLVLNMALILGKMINMKYPDVEVVYTRTTDVFIPLHVRTAIANKQHADLFISIHCNAISNPNTKGTETFVMGLHRAADNLEVAKRENAVILLEENYEQNYEGFDPNSPVGHILLSSFQDAYLNRSIQLASFVEKSFANRRYTKSRGVKQAGFAVLRRATMPSILVEAGFMSNIEEEKYLGTEAGQLEIANSIFESIEKFGTMAGSSVYVESTKQNSKELNENNITESNKSQNSVEVASSTSNSQENKYRIQIAALQKDMTDSMVKDKNIQKIGSVHVVKDGNLFKYQIGDYASHTEAKSAKDKLVALGYSNSFLTVVK